MVECRIKRVFVIDIVQGAVRYGWTDSEEGHGIVKKLLKIPLRQYEGSEGIQQRQRLY